MAVAIISAFICLLMVVSIIFFPKIKLKNVQLNTYCIVVIAGAAIMLAARFIGFTEIAKGLTASAAINPIEILVLFISMAALSIFLDEIGMFAYLANAVLKKSKVSQKRLFFFLYAIVSVLTIFTSNDIIILTFTPFVCYFCKNGKINPIPYLMAEFTAANTWSMLFIIGNPTNVYLATSAGISFLDYLVIMALPTVFGGVVSCCLLYLIYKKQLKEEISEIITQDVGISDKGLLVIGLTHLGCCTVFLVLSSYINIEMWLISAAFAISLFCFVVGYKALKKCKPRELVSCIKRLPYELIPFVICMFIIILSLEKADITKRISDLLGGSAVIYKYGGVSFLAANFLNNIPMSVLFESITKNLSGTAQLQAVYATIISSNIGALFTPIGALAGIMWMTILKKHDIKFKFADFVKYGAAISILTLATALAGLNLSMYIFA